MHLMRSRLAFAMRRSFSKPTRGARSYEIFRLSWQREPGCGVRFCQLRSNAATNLLIYGCKSSSCVHINIPILSATVPYQIYLFWFFKKMRCASMQADRYGRYEYSTLYTIVLFVSNLANFLREYITLPNPLLTAQTSPTI